MVVTPEGLKARISKKLADNHHIIFLVKHYGDRSRAVMKDLMDLICERYSLNRDFGVFLRTLLMEVLNNGLRENYFFFLAQALWEDHLNAMKEAGQEKAIAGQSFDRYIMHLRSSMTFLNRVRDFNLKRIEMARLLDEERKATSKRIFTPELQTLHNLNERYKVFTHDHKNIVRFSIHPQNDEISFTIINRSYLDELALERLRTKVIERIQSEEENTIQFEEDMLDQSQGGHGLGSFLIRDVLSEKGFNTIKESLVIFPDSSRQTVSTTLTLDRDELARFR
ncbi:MAG: hypothetical protein KDK38_03915 [Leptospiraceae bacterium]|nr:hypothetical protein [Leptospiraceae bacterium]